VPNVSYGDIELGDNDAKEAPALKRQEALRILTESEEPYRTLGITAWVTGVRPGELLALTLDDLDFENKTVRVDETADDSTRIRRKPKMPKSAALLPMPSALETVLRNYLDHHWKPNPAGFLFPNPDGTRPRSRDNVVKYWLKPLLKKLGIPSHGLGLHAFRRGLATELANASVPLPVLQNQMRHADVRTTLKFYCRVVPESQRAAMENIGQAISTLVPISTVSAA
jgi:integrase